MNSIKVFFKNHLILGIVELVLLVATLATFLIPLKSYNYSGSDFQSETGIWLDGLFGVEEGGYYIDDSIYDEEAALASNHSTSMGIEGPGMYSIYSPATNLRFGSYEISMKYLNGDANNTYTCISEYNTMPVIVRRGDVSLGVKEDGNQEFLIYLRSGLNVNDYQVAFNYRGNSYLFVYGLEIKETTWWKWLLVLSVVTISIFLNMFIAMWEKNDKKQRARVFILSAILILSILPILGVYTTTGHDFNFHIGRFLALKDSLKTGQFPNRISSFWLNGMGYAASIFYCDLFLFPSAVLMYLGASIQTAYKFYIIFISVLTLLAAYHSLKKLIGDEKAALIGTLIYMVSPYRLECLYTRAAVGEYTGLVFYPLVMLGLYNIYAHEVGDSKEKLLDRVKRLLPLIVGASGLICCHVLSTLMAVLFCIAIAIIYWKKTFKLSTLCDIGVVLGAVILINLWFIVPFLHVMAGGIGGMNVYYDGRFRSNGAYFWQILNMFPKAGGASFAAEEAVGLYQAQEMSYAVGPALICFIVYLALRFGTDKIKKEKAKIPDLFLGMSIVTLIMTTVFFPWDFINQLCDQTSLLLKNIQFPWRFLGVLSLLLAVLGGYIYVMLRDSKEKYEILSMIFAAIMVVLCGISANYFVASCGEVTDWQMLPDMDEDVEVSVMGAEYLPTGSHLDELDPYSVNAGDGIVVDAFRRENGRIYVTLTNNSGSDGEMEVPFIYYKGYKSENVLTGERYPVTKSEGNLALVNVPAGYEGEICVFYREPVLWRICELISFISILGLAVCLGYKRK